MANCPARANNHRELLASVGNSMRLDPRDTVGQCDVARGGATLKWTLEERKKTRGRLIQFKKGSEA